MKPGSTSVPSASMTTSAFAPSGTSPIAAILPLRTQTSARTTSHASFMVTTVPLRIRSDTREGARGRGGKGEDRGGTHRRAALLGPPDLPLPLAPLPPAPSSSSAPNDATEDLPELAEHRPHVPAVNVAVLMRLGAGDERLVKYPRAVLGRELAGVAIDVGVHNPVGHGERNAGPARQRALHEGCPDRE